MNTKVMAVSLYRGWEVTVWTGTLTAIKEKHVSKAKLVHDDLRLPSLLVVTQSDSGSEKLLVVDYDWAGDHGVSTYPIAVNPSETWHDVQAGKIMMVEHDAFMVTDLLRM